VQYLRAQVRKRDQGVCALCKTDTLGLLEKLNALRQFDRAKWKRTLEAIGISPARLHGELWDADHIVPVSEGGGLCGLENIRTLCIPCHHDQTAALAARRRKRT